MQFNLSIIDIPEVNTEVKKHLLTPPYVGPDLPPAVVEISLRTSDGDSMALELWSFSFSENTDPPMSTPSTIYNRMVTLLKSILAVTRTVPAYKLARRQGSDTYIICYRVYAGHQSSVVLGEGSKLHQIGQVATPFGTVGAVVEYRTHLALSPHKAEIPILIKSDHFQPESSPKSCREAAIAVRPVFSSGSGSDESVESNRLFINTPPNDAISGIRKLRSESPLVGKCGAFATDVTLQGPVLPDLPLVDIIAQEIEETKRLNMDKVLERKRRTSENLAKSPPDNSTKEPKSSQGSNQSLQHIGEDFVLIDMKLPFAETDTQGADIGSFYKQCQAAPPLSSFDNDPTLSEQVNELTDQLKDFETRSKDFDDLVRSLCSDTELE
ncbi:autophagy-related protein 13-like isoform X2 [Artemia franciscana]|uniref:autophagy-related protein 13-like isoform X2 n=1 Tax=Artemia franciscana TaxID=6661 RepID=UPI0032DA4032